MQHFTTISYKYRYTTFFIIWKKGNFTLASLIKLKQINDFCLFKAKKKNWSISKKICPQLRQIPSPLISYSKLFLIKDLKLTNFTNIGKF